MFLCPSNLHFAFLFLSDITTLIPYPLDIFPFPIHPPELFVTDKQVISNNKGIYFVSLIHTIMCSQSIGRQTGLQEAGGRRVPLLLPAGDEPVHASPGVEGLLQVVHVVHLGVVPPPPPSGPSGQGPRPFPTFPSSFCLKYLISLGFRLG